MTRRALVLACLVVTAGLIGCLGDGEQPTAGTDGQEAASSFTGGQLTLHLDEDMALVGQPPDRETPEAVPVGSFYTAWAQGQEQPTWQAPRGLAADFLVTEATLTFYYTSETAVTTTGPQDQGFPEFVVYVGSQQAPMGWASLQGPDVVAQGEVVEITAEMTLPTGGLVLPAGTPPIVKIAPVQGQQDEASQVQILVNGTQAPSRVTLETQAAALPDHTERQVLDETGTLAGQAYVIGQTEGASSQTFQVELGPDTVGLVARMERTAGIGIADIDLEARGPDGEIVAQSVTPEDREGLALYLPNVDAVGAGTWELRVTNYGNVVAEFSLQASLLERA